MPPSVHVVGGPIFQVVLEAKHPAEREFLAEPCVRHGTEGNLGVLRKAGGSGDFRHAFKDTAPACPGV